MRFTFENDFFDKRHNPGLEVTLSGIYRCDTCKQDEVFKKGDVFPDHKGPHSEMQKGPVLWRLIVAPSNEYAYFCGDPV